MGAWGYGLFENDSDLDTIGELADECGLRRIQEDAQELAEVEHDKAKEATTNEENATKAESDANQKDGIGEGLEDDDENFEDVEDEELDRFSIMYSLYSQYCSDIKVVREYLDGGALEKLIEKHKGYTLMLIGVCAMSLGCTLSEDFLAKLRKQFPRCRFRSKARNQVGKALFGPSGFENGKEHDFQSKGLFDTMASASAMDGDDAEEEEELY